MTQKNNQPDKVSDVSFKADWSGFISQDFSKPINVMRDDILEQIKSVEGRSWRDFIGDTLLYLFENATAEEMLELLTKANYVDQRAYVEAAKSLGVEANVAKNNYQNLILK